MEAMNTAAKTLLDVSARLDRKMKESAEQVADLDQKMDTLRRIEVDTTVKSNELTQLNDRVEAARTALAQIKAGIPG
jgi:predicted  nucleic acid-binding Zn-ribbon protein